MCEPGQNKGRTESSGSFDDGEGEDLDPRVKSELEQLNAATDGINHLETELNEAQVLFQQMMDDSSLQLKALHQKLGKCVDKSRPYYDALKDAKLARTQLHEVTLTYEMAQVQHFNAKKRVVEVERKANASIDGRLDPLLQESMNQVTTEVMETAIALEEAEKKYFTFNDDFNTKHTNLQQVYEKLKTTVGKSRPFFELKSNLNRNLEVQKQRVDKIQEGIQVSKQAYSETLNKLQVISEDIHRSRNLKRQSATSSASDTSSTRVTTRVSHVDDTSELSIEDDTRSVDSFVSGCDSIWDPKLNVDDTRSTTSSRDIEYNHLNSRVCGNSCNNNDNNDNNNNKNNNDDDDKDKPLSKIEIDSKNTGLGKTIDCPTESENNTDDQNVQSNSNNEQNNVSNGRNKVSGNIVIKVNDAIQGMQDTLATSPYECISSHTVEYTMPSEFHKDYIDGRYDETTRRRSFNDLLKISLDTFGNTLGLSKDRCKSLPNVLDAN